MNHAPLSWIPKWDVLFEIHSMEHLRATHAHSTMPSEYLSWLEKQPGPGQEGHKPIYMQQHQDSIPASLPLPREELNKWFEEKCGQKGYFAQDYYTSTISWMIALAMMQGRPEIHLYGIDLLQEEEYIYQRAGAEYLVGFARGMGIKVFVPEQASLCKANYTYGFSHPPEHGQYETLIKYIEDKAKLSEEQATKARQDANTFNGALQMADLMLGWLTSQPEGKTVEQAVQEKKAEMQNRFKHAEAAAMTMTGQSEAFKTTVVWTKHHARGGALNL
jgi:hypothetical protein